MRGAVRAFAAIAALLLVLPGCGGPAPRGPAPDVVVVLVDTLRPDHLGFHGYERAMAPFLAELAAESAVFLNARSSSSWTAPATASLLTGLYPLRHGVVVGVRAQRREHGADDDAHDDSLPFRRLPADVTTLAERFAAAGHRTFAVTTNINVGPDLGLLRGFDQAEHLRGATAPEVAERLRALEPALRAESSPYFLYLHFMDPHNPYHGREPWYEPAEEKTADLVSAYDSEIAYFDAAFREIHERMGWHENTVLVMLSDHGEEFYEHGRLGHKFSLHGELNDILLLMRGPGIAPARIDATVSIVDVQPTLAELTGIDAAPGDGRSLVPLLRGDAAAFEDRVVFAHRTGGSEHLWAAIEGPWKWIEGAESAALYDRRTDPGEHRDVSAQHPEVRDRLAARLAEHRRPGIRPVEATRLELDDDTRAALEALGYVGEMEGP